MTSPLFDKQHPGWDIAFLEKHWETCRTVIASVCLCLCVHLWELIESVACPMLGLYATLFLLGT